MEAVGISEPKMVVVWSDGGSVSAPTMIVSPPGLIADAPVGTSAANGGVIAGVLLALLAAGAAAGGVLIVWRRRLKAAAAEADTEFGLQKEKAQVSTDVFRPRTGNALKLLFASCSWKGAWRGPGVNEQKEQGEQEEQEEESQEVQQEHLEVEFRGSVSVEDIDPELGILFREGDLDELASHAAEHVEWSSRHKMESVEQAVPSIQLGNSIRSMRTTGSSIVVSLDEVLANLPDIYDDVPLVSEQPKPTPKVAHSLPDIHEEYADGTMDHPRQTSTKVSSTAPQREARTPTVSRNVSFGFAPEPRAPSLSSSPSAVSTPGQRSDAARRGGIESDLPEDLPAMPGTQSARSLCTWKSLFDNEDQDGGPARKAPSMMGQTNSRPALIPTGPSCRTIHSL